MEKADQERSALDLSWNLQAKTPLRCMLGRIEKLTDTMTMRKNFENSNYDLWNSKPTTKELMTLLVIILGFHSLDEL